MAKMKSRELEAKLEAMIAEQDRNLRMWNEFDRSLVAVKEVQFRQRKIAGVKIPELAGVDFTVKDFNVFLSPKWYPAGISVLQDLMKLVIEKELSKQKEEMLEHARKKTTQKVNLYEKVQIPSYQSAIMKIKRFLEDEENLTKAAQKIVKTRQQSTAEVQP